MKIDIRKRQMLLLAGNALIVTISFHLTPLVLSGMIPSPGAIFRSPDLFAILSYLLVFYLFDLFDLDLRFSKARFLVRLVLAQVTVAILIAAGSFVFQERPYGMRVLAVQGMLVFVLALVWSMFFERLMTNTTKALRVAVLGCEDTAESLRQALGRRPDYAVALTLKKGWEDRVGSLINEKAFDEIVVNTKRGISPESYRALIEAKMRGVAVSDVPGFYERVLERLPVSGMSDVWLAHVPLSGVRKTVYNRRLKRILGVLISLVALAILLPVMLLIAVVIRMESPGPVLYRQRRIGLNRVPFDLVKFRSMKMGTEFMRENAGRQDDPRITRVGGVIRKYRLDELPQLWNVLRGDMCLVGPRALMEEEVEAFERRISYFTLRHFIRPGITGWAQINYPHGTTVEDARAKLEYDLYYMKNASMSMDLHILLRTMRTVLLAKGGK
ncbi:MAG TPA: sugar transferase [Syntrophales bacterium]|nr:sugar transferase [Syntrophales bacterium]